MEYEEELYHHGIPNMKWGQRRFQYEDGTLTPAGRERYRKKKSSTKNNTSKSKAGLFAKKKPPEPARKSISEMSDDEIRNLINRAKLEQEYKQYVLPKKTNRGKSVVMEILGGAAKDVAKTYTKRIMITGVDKALYKMGIELKADSTKKKKDKKDDKDDD